MKTIKVRSSNVELFFELEDSQGQKTPRVFSASNDKDTIIPVDYAKSFYNSVSVIKWLEQGKLLVTQGKDELEKSAIEEQYISEPITVTDQSAILEVLKGNDLTKIKQLFRGEDKELALELAMLNAEDLRQAVVGFIEDEVGLSLTND